MVYTLIINYAAMHTTRNMHLMYYYTTVNVINIISTDSTWISSSSRQTAFVFVWEEEEMMFHWLSTSTPQPCVYKHEWMLVMTLFWVCVHVCVPVCPWLTQYKSQSNGWRDRRQTREISVWRLNDKNATTRGRTRGTQDNTVRIFNTIC